MQSDTAQERKNSGLKDDQNTKDMYKTVIERIQKMMKVFIFYLTYSFQKYIKMKLKLRRVRKCSGIFILSN